MNPTRYILINFVANLLCLPFLVLLYSSCQKEAMLCEKDTLNPYVGRSGQIKLPENYQYEGPEFVWNATQLTINRLNEWVGDDEIYLLAHITDIHSGGNKNYQHIGYLDKLNGLFGFDILVNGGDIGLDTPATPDTQSEYNLIQNIKNEMSQANPWICCKGNHERNLSNEEFGNIFNKTSEMQKSNIVFGGSDGCYGYIDDVTSKTRLIFLNTTDAPLGEHYGMSRAQLEWLAATLSNINSGWKIIVTSHYMPHRIGAWATDGSIFNMPCFKTLRAILQSFANRRKGECLDLQLTWDYSHIDAKMVCILSGDSHFDNHTKEEGVNYIVTQGYGHSSPEVFPDGCASFTWFDPTADCLFTILAVKPNGIAKIFNIGSTAEPREFEFCY